jgi:hypothetical protein
VKLSGDHPLRIHLWDPEKQEKDRMTPTSKKFTASAATLFAFAFFVMTAPTAQADDYCITGGAQAAHGCGYQTMEACRAASSGIGGTCSLNSSSKNSSDSLAYQPKQPHSRSELRPRKEPIGH